jgi:hypothetical protein
MLLICGGGVGWYVVRQQMVARARAELQFEALRRKEEALRLSEEAVKAEKERMERESTKDRERDDETDNEEG